MGGGGGFVGKVVEGNYLNGNGGGSGHFATMNFSNLAEFDKKLVVKIGSGGLSREPGDLKKPLSVNGGDTVVDMNGVELSRALGGRNGFSVGREGGGATQGWEILNDIPVLNLKHGRGGQLRYKGQGGLIVDGTGPSHDDGLGLVEGYGSGGSNFDDAGKGGVVIVYPTI